MSTHARTQLVDQAENELTTAWLDIRDRHGLTVGEAISVLARFGGDAISRAARLLVRLERHGNTDKPGDVG